MDEAIKSGDLPNDAKIIAQILKSMGIDEVQGRVIPQLLEFMHRYVREVLEDAAIYANHAGKTGLDLDDVRLAIQSRVNYSFTQPPPREFLIELAHGKNAVPLPFPPLHSLSSTSLPATRSTVVLPPPQLRVKPLEWDWPARHSSSSASSSPSSASTLSVAATLSPSSSLSSSTSSAPSASSPSPTSS
jgi:transcription initiation factor TFIID subunit 9B